MLDQRLATRVENFVSRLKRESVCMHGFILDVRGEVKATARGWAEKRTRTATGRMTIIFRKP